MIRWKIKTLEELNEEMNFTYNEGSFPSDIYGILGKFIDELDPVLNNIDNIRNTLNIHYDTRVRISTHNSYVLPFRWFTPVNVGIDIKLVIIDGQSVKVGGVFMVKERAYLIEKISKSASKITINDKFDVNEIELINSSLITDMM